MKRKFYLAKVVLSICTLGLIVTSCEQEQMNETLDANSMQLEEAPPFKNYMVITADSEMTKSVENYLKTSDGEIVNSIPEIGISIVSSKDANFIQNTLKNKNVTSVVPDYDIAWIPTSEGVEAHLPEATPSIGSTEPYYYYDYLWGLEAIDAPQAWNAGFTGEGASVFVLDSGIDAEHIELAPNLNTDLCASFVPGEHWNILTTTPFDNHGTHVAGTIAAAQNDKGLIGVAPNVELVAVKVLSEFTGSGAFSSINAGIVYAANNGADVINMSLGVTLNKNGTLIDADGNSFRIPAKYIQEVIIAQQRAIDYAFKKGTTIIASAGNDYTNYDGNTSLIKLPGGLNNVITVSATAPEGYDWTAEYTNFDVPASYTTYGRSLVDVAAPGGDVDVALHDMILSTGNNNSLYWSAGTSMAAPHVSGVAALIIAKNGGQMDPQSVAKQLSKTADKIDGNGQSAYFGKGRVNAFRAVTE
jgi:subtilisin family serine protease